MGDIKFSFRYPKINQLMYDLGFLQPHEKSIELIKERISELNSQFDLGKKYINQDIACSEECGRSKNEIVQCRFNIF